MKLSVQDSDYSGDFSLKTFWSTNQDIFITVDFGYNLSIALAHFNHIIQWSDIMLCDVCFPTVLAVLSTPVADVSA